MIDAFRKAQDSTSLKRYMTGRYLLLKYPVLLGADDMNQKRTREVRDTLR